MPKYLPVFDNTEEIEKEKVEESQSFDMGTLKAAGVGALNQFNLLAPTIAGFQTLTGSKPVDSELSDEEWAKLSIKDRFKANKEPIQEKINALEDEYPVASMFGNIAGGIIPAFFTGGTSLTGTAAKTGAKLLPKVASAASKVSPSKLKLAGQIADSSLIAGTDTAMFERDPEKRGEAFLKGAGIGALFPAALAGGKKILTKGENTKKYIDRIPELLEQRKEGKRPVSDLQNKVKAKIEVDDPQFQKEAEVMSSSIQDSLIGSSNKQQVNEFNLLDDLYDAKSNLQRKISTQSTGGYEVLNENKKLSTNSLKDVIVENAKKTDLKADPNAGLYKKYIDRVEDFGGSVDEIELKKFYNALSSEIENVTANQKRGSYTSPIVGTLKRLRDTAQNMLKESNPEYAKLMKPLAEQTKKSKNIEKILRFNSSDPKSTLAALKSYKNDVKVQETLDDIMNMSGVDLRPIIDSVVESESVLTTLNKNSPETFKKILTSSTKDPIYQKFLVDLDNYKRTTGIDLLPEINQLRNKYNVDLLNKVKALTKPNEKTDVSLFQKNVRNLNLEDYDKKNFIQRIVGDDIPSDIETKQVRSDKVRRDIKDLSDYIGENAAKNTTDIEAASLYDWLGKGKTNGSRNVNLGTFLGTAGSTLLGAGGGALGGSIGGPIGTAIGATIGALGGALKDTGVVQRARREILDALYNPENKNKISRLNNAMKYEGSVALPVEIQKQDNRENQAIATFEDYYKSNRVGELVNRQKEINEEAFGRSGS